MEANFFRCFVRDVAPRLTGRRIDKVYVPAAGVWTLRLGSRTHLLCIASGKQSALFLSAVKPDNPTIPSAETGWWRKRIQGRKVLEVVADWPARRLACRLNTSPGAWLIIDVPGGLSLVDDLPGNFGQPPAWPSLDRIVSDTDIFRNSPQITPPLRHTLSALDSEKGRHLLALIQSGESAPPYTWAKARSGGGQDWLVPWAVPGTLHDRFLELTQFTGVLEAAEAYGWSVFERLCQKRSGDDQARKLTRKKVRKRLAGIARDEERLQEMIALGEQAELLKNRLYALDPDRKVDAVEVTDDQGNVHSLSLNPRLTVKENMERWFHRARKGRRGLHHAARRRREAEMELEALEKRPIIGHNSWTGGNKSMASRGKKTPSGPGTRDHKVPKDVQVFVSSDGFRILRGKNSRANHQLVTKAARGHDLWFHAAHGPGTHVVLQRPAPNTEVPEKSRKEAAVLAALRSHFAGSAKGEVMCAQVKHVNPVKGLGPGQVTVREVLETLVVPLDPDMETRLRQGGGDG